MKGHYKIGTLAKRTGFSHAVLRAWERRFGLLEPERGEGGHRLYTDDDLRVLQRVRMLIDEGRSIGEIARPGRNGLLAQSVTDDAVRQASDLPEAAALDDWQGRIISAAIGP